MSHSDTTKQEVEQVESVHRPENAGSVQDDDLSFKNYTEKEEQKKKNILVRFKDSIYQKPEKTENVWKLLTNLTNTQRITFAAGKKKIGGFAGVNITIKIESHVFKLYSILWLDFGCF